VTENGGKVPVGFSEWCRDTIDEWMENYLAQAGDTWENRKARAWLQAEVRIDEAKAVEPVVDRFVTAEMEAHRRGIGRNTRWTHYAKSLGCRYRRRLASGRVDAHDAAQLITRTLAIGYAGTLDAQAQMTDRGLPARTSEAIWNYWIVRVLGDPVRELRPKQHIAHVEKLGIEMFRRSAYGLGLKRLGRGTMGAQALGILYVKAGMMLRLAQSLPDEFLTGDLLQGVNRWPWTADTPSRPLPS
jgi:hypothetical protein